ncbi:MAG: hypothetical protein H8E44_37325 [Planctomycetes bacterium]|nr:hypothetical protein [Planctomycetota bacterium]
MSGVTNRMCIAVVLVATSVVLSVGAEPAPATVCWTSGAALMPAWGFYPNGTAYGGTPPLGDWAAWTASGGTHRLTWVADFPSDGAYHFWVRKYGGYGGVRLTVDERPVTGGRGGPGGARYVWIHLGAIAVSKGAHHVDVDVTGGMLDAVLFTSGPGFRPAEHDLPEPVKEPVVRALRRYRDDSGLRAAAAQRGFVVGAVMPYREYLYDWMPSEDEILTRLPLWGAADQYVNGTFAVRALDAADEVRVSLDELTGPEGTVIGVDQIDLRVVHVRERVNALYRDRRPKMLIPELLLRDDRTAIPPKGEQGGWGGGHCVAQVPAHESRQFWLTVQVPAGAVSENYSGEILLHVKGSETRTLRLPVRLEVLPVDLRPPEGYYGIYYPGQPVDPKRPNYVPPERYLAELQDQVRHGLNTTTLYGGYSTLKYASQAGMTRAPCLMHWPGGAAAEQVQEAKAMGFDDLYYYGVDEPHGERIERCRKEAERRLKAGLHMMTAINSRDAQQATRDFIDRPVYNIYVFGGTDNAAAMYVREKGFQPISYWTTATAFPMWYRSLTGLYNTACGYLGSSPWSYWDMPGEEVYNPDRIVHRVVYPDEFGQPIPTLAWEAHRAGIDDVRYLEALDRAIAKAAKRLEKSDPPPGLADALERAKRVRRERFESIQGRWFQYMCGLRLGQLEATRREFAEAIVYINRANGS